MISLVAQPSRITVAVQTAAAKAVPTKGDYTFTIDSGTSRLIISPAVDEPTNLQVTSGAPGSDIAFSWFAGTGATSYIIQVHDNLGMRREFTTIFTSAVYTAAQAVNDGGHKRSYTIKVASWNPSVGRSEYAELVVENAAPATPVVNVTPASLGFTVASENTLESDYAGMIVWASATPGVSMVDGNKVYDSYSQTANFAWSASDTAYFLVARYDTFGKTDLNVSSEIASTKTAVAGLIQTDTLPGTTYLGDDVVFYTVDEEFYQWNAAALPDPTYERTEPSILNGQLYALDLKVISAAVGELKLGQMTMDAYGHIRGGQTAWDDGIGFWLGWYGINDYRFSIGDSTAEKLTYENGNLVFSGALSAATGTLGTLTMGSGGYIQSSNYVSGTSGWKLSETGAEFNTGLTVDYADITGTKPPADADNTADTIEAGTTITAGGITMSSGGAIKGGQTDYNTGTGWFLGYSGGEYKFSIGNPSGARLTWDGVDDFFVTGGATTYSASAASSVCTVSNVVVPSGAKVCIVAYGDFYSSANFNTANLILKRDTTTVKTGAQTGFGYYTSAYGSSAIVYEDSPAAGTYSYSVTCSAYGYSTGLLVFVIG